MTPICEQPVLRKPPKRIQISNIWSKECSDREFYKIENLGHPKIIWGISGQIWIDFIILGLVYSEVHVTCDGMEAEGYVEVSCKDGSWPPVIK